MKSYIDLLKTSGDQGDEGDAVDAPSEGRAVASIQLNRHQKICGGAP